MNLLLALLLVGAEPVAVGQMVMPKEGAVLRAGGQPIEDNGKTGVPYQVQQIRDSWYLVHGSASGWIKQSDVVPLAAAPAYYTPLIELRPTEWLFRMRGVARNNLGEYDQAIADLTAAIELQPTEAALNQRGEAWRMKREYDRAIEDYDEAVRRDPQMTLAFANRGIAWRAKGDLDRALADFDEALRLAPYYTRVLCSRASLWGAKGDPAARSRTMAKPSATTQRTSPLTLAAATPGARSASSTAPSTIAIKPSCSSLEKRATGSTTARCSPRKKSSTPASSA